jgi:hypothetical protein
MRIVGVTLTFGLILAGRGASSKSITIRRGGLMENGSVCAD